MSEGLYLAGFAIAIIAVFVLIAVVLIQNRKIREASHPKFGFLGKPLSFIALVLLMGGGYVMIYYAGRNQPETLEVSANQEVSLEVIVTEINTEIKQYKINAIPVIDKKEWGGDTLIEFDIYWTIATADGNLTTEIENDLTSAETGGINVTLPSGTNTVKATLFVNDEVIEKEVEIDVL